MAHRPTAPLAAIAVMLTVGVALAGAAPAVPPPMQRVVVTLTHTSSLTDLRGPRQLRVHELIRRRRRDADTGFAQIRNRLASWTNAGQIRNITRLWVTNGVVMDATPTVVAALQADPAVAHITSDATPLVPFGSPVEWNVGRIRADTVWDLGHRGQGVVVASLDTGVDVDHPDLTTRWRGGTNSWFDPFGQHPSTPTDLNGHGTQVMGVIVGGDAGGSAIGVAPGARWIAARVFNDQGLSSVAAIHQAFQWVLDPDGDPATDDAPDVVNSSWGFASGTCNLEFAPDIEALRAAGIVPIFAAGNFGTLSTSPADNPGAFAVGSTTAADAVAVDSSRGPTACGEPSGIYPELTAPGVAVRTTDLGGLFTTASGTSLAAPHVAGALAVLLSANPTLTLAQQTSLLEHHAVDLGTPGPDNTYGFGRLDLRAAYDALPPVTLDQTGPVIAQTDVSPAITAAGIVSIAASATDAAGTVAAAEWFTGADPGAGSATPLRARDGVFDQATELLAASADAGLLEPGSHTINVRARDAAGNWGVPQTTTLVVDRTGPTVTLESDPLRTNLAAPIPYDLPAGNCTRFALVGTATDGNATIAEAEWYEGPDPGRGFGTPLVVTGATLRGTIDFVTPGWHEGAHQIWVRARDGVGNWGSPTAISVIVVRPNVIFANTVTAGDIASWDAVTGARRLRFVNARDTPLNVTLGGRLSTSASGPAYLTDNSPASEATYLARLMFSPGTSRTGSDPRGVVVLAGYSADNGRGRRALELRYRREGSRRQVQLTVATRHGAARTPWRTLTSARPASIELTWAAGDAATAAITVDAVRTQALTGLDTGRDTRIESIRLGVQELPRALPGRSGSFRLGRFASARRTLVEASTVTRFDTAHAPVHLVKASNHAH